jgi:hypothetical protein
MFGTDDVQAQGMPLQELPVGASLLSEQHQSKTFDANDNQLFFFLL